MIGLHKEEKQLDYSKKLVYDIRILLWLVTIGCLLLSLYCIYKGYIGSLPWLSAISGLPWSAHGVVCSMYLQLARSDHSEGGITFEAAKAANFGTLISGQNKSTVVDHEDIESDFDSSPPI